MKTVNVYGIKELQKIAEETVNKKTQYITVQLDKQREQIIDLQRIIQNLFEAKRNTR